ncbi:MAG TPA: hypothetical protein VE964_10440 [Myxococcales bacterium]|nr:hypothetical protein [Myxococcales bacterium]
MIERIARTALLAAAGLLLLGHSPYRQWYAYRAKHLVVVSAESRPGSAALAQAVAEAIAAGVPGSKAVAAAVHTPLEVVKLLSSGQLQVGLLPSADARQAFQGTGSFAEDGPVPLRAVAILGDDLLVVLDSYPNARSRDLARAIAARPGKWPELVPATFKGAPPVPFHDGVTAG